MPLTRERWQSSRCPAPKACDTSVSRPAISPSAKNTNTMKILELMLTAPMASALYGRRPTIMVSTITMLIQPSSASTSGNARRSVGRSSERNVENKSMRNRKVYDGQGEKEKSEKGKRKEKKKQIPYFAGRT